MHRHLRKALALSAAALALTLVIGAQWAQVPFGASLFGPPPEHDEAPLLEGWPLQRTGAAVANLKHTGKKALVVYGVTHRRAGPVFDVEMRNLDFFERHGMLPVGLRTALFTQVDFAFQRVAVSGRSAVESRLSDNPRILFECGVKQRANTTVPASEGSSSPPSSGARSNVRAFRQYRSPCDLCAVSRLLSHLGVSANSTEYAFIVLLNSGARGPFFSARIPSAKSNTGMRSGTSIRDVAPHYTWVDELALGGEEQFSGTVATSNAGSVEREPHLQTYAIGFPVGAVASLSPLFASACPHSDKNWCIRQVEVKVARTLVESGFKVRSLLQPSPKPFDNVADLGKHMATARLNVFKLKHVDPRRMMFVKFGGEMWEKGLFQPTYVKDVVHRTWAADGGETRSRHSATHAPAQSHNVTVRDIRDALYDECREPN